MRHRIPRAFPAGHREIPADYRAVGQPVFIPGSMGTASWVLAGAEGAVRETFGSVCHGAGRLLSRTAARQGRNAGEERDKLEERGILVRSESRDGILEELPDAYKDVDEVIEVVHNAGLARKVARLRAHGGHQRVKWGRRFRLSTRRSHAAYRMTLSSADPSTAASS